MKRSRTRAAGVRKATPVGRMARLAGAGEVRIDVKLVDGTMALLVAHDRVAARLEVGAHVFDVYFGGDERLVRSKSPRKDKSYAAVRERARFETTWDELMLRRAVMAVIVARSLSAGIADEINWTCLWMLYAVRNLVVRRKLAERIVRGELYGEAAEEAIEKAAERERDGGQPRAPGVEQVLTGVERLLDRAESGDTFDIERLRKLGVKGKAAGERAEKIGMRFLDLGKKIKNSID